MGESPLTPPPNPQSLSLDIKNQTNKIYYKWEEHLNIVKQRR